MAVQSERSPCFPGLEDLAMGVDLRLAECDVAGAVAAVETHVSNEMIEPHAGALKDDPWVRTQAFRLAFRGLKTFWTDKPHAHMLADYIIELRPTEASYEPGDPLLKAFVEEFNTEAFLMTMATALDDGDEDFTGHLEPEKSQSPEINNPGDEYLDKLRGDLEAKLQELEKTTIEARQFLSENSQELSGHERSQVEDFDTHICAQDISSASEIISQLLGNEDSFEVGLTLMDILDAEVAHLCGKCRGVEEINNYLAQVEITEDTEEVIWLEWDCYVLAHAFYIARQEGSIQKAAQYLDKSLSPSSTRRSAMFNALSACVGTEDHQEK